MLGGSAVGSVGAVGAVGAAVSMTSPVAWE